jgi:hypothetical protein
LQSSLAIDTNGALKRRPVGNANGAGIPSSSAPHHRISLRRVTLAKPISFRSIHNSHSLTNNFYRRRSSSLPILTLPSSSMPLLLHAQELSLEQHPARNNENRYRANDRYHAPRGRLVAWVENAFAGDSQRCCGTACWVERFAIEEIADWFCGRFGCGFGCWCWCLFGSFWWEGTGSEGFSGWWCCCVGADWR